jgi:hypothetical protein
MSLHTLAGIAWDPQIRGFLATAVGVVVLMGSVYLLLLTNTGARLGFLIAGAGFFGWMVIMGLIWWVYGTIGMLGTAPHWEVQEVVYPGVEDAALDEARILDTSALPPPEEYKDLEGDDYEQVREDVEPTLNGWQLLPESNPSFGEAQATVDAYIAANPLQALGDEEHNGIDGPSEYVTTYAFERGGKDGLPDDPSRLDRITTFLKTTFWQVRHPPRYAIVQVHPVTYQEAEPGEPPPTPEPDPDEPVVSVIMQRDLGDVRFPAAMVTIFSAIMFGVLCSMLHRRDERVAAARSLVPAPAEG